MTTKTITINRIVNKQPMAIPIIAPVDSPAFGGGMEPGHMQTYILTLHTEYDITHNRGS